LEKVAVLYSADTFVVNQSLVLRINVCDENRHLCQAANRCVQLVFHSKEILGKNTPKKRRKNGNKNITAF